MSGRCKVPGCTATPPRGGYGWCPTHRANWKRHGTPTPTSEVKAVAARRRVDPVPVAMPAPVVVDLAPAAVGHRCGSCGRVFPLLVDDVLCIRCDSLHYPAAVAS